MERSQCETLRCTRTAASSAMCGRRCVPAEFSFTVPVRSTYRRTRSTVEWLAFGVRLRTGGRYGRSGLGYRTGGGSRNGDLPFPHRVQSEGFFAAVLRKGDGRVRVQVPKPAKRYLHRWRAREGEEAAGFRSASRSRCFSSGSARISMPIMRAVFSGCAGNIREPFSVLCSGVLWRGELFREKATAEHSLALFHDILASAGSGCGIVAR